MFAAIGFAGNQPFNDWFEPDTTQRMPLGLKLNAVDEYWGFGEFVYVKANATMEKGSLVQWDASYQVTDLPSTANMGRRFAVLMNSMTAGQYGWACISGMSVPVSASASVAADTAVGIGTAGTAGTNSAGKQLLGIHNLRASTATVVLTNVQTRNGSAILKTNGYAGWFLGMALSGTGVPASTVVARLYSDGKTVAMGSAIGTVDKLATATGAVSVTGTYTGYLGMSLGYPFTQGAIT